MKHSSIIISPQGFSLIETIVALAIIISSLTGAMYAAHKSYSYGILSRDQVIAFHLAQEAIEFVRFTRDTNILEGAPEGWLDGLDSCIGDTCRIDVVSGEVRVCAEDDCTLHFDEVTGRYGHSSTWDTTIFSRSVTIEEVRADQEAEVIVTMEWQRRGGLAPGIFILRERILNWQE